MIWLPVDMIDEALLATSMKKQKGASRTLYHALDVTWEALNAWVPHVTVEAVAKDKGPVHRPCLENGVCKHTPEGKTLARLISNIESRIKPHFPAHSDAGG